MAEWTCQHGVTHSGSEDFISGVRMAHEEYENRPRFDPWPEPCARCGDRMFDGDPEGQPIPVCPNCGPTPQPGALVAHICCGAVVTDGKCESCGLRNAGVYKRVLVVPSPAHPDPDWYTPELLALMFEHLRSLPPESEASTLGSYGSSREGA